MGLSVKGRVLKGGRLICEAALFVEDRKLVPDKPDRLTDKMVVDLWWMGGDLRPIIIPARIRICKNHFSFEILTKM